MATMEERIPHIRTLCEKFLAEGQDAALNYAVDTHGRDLIPGKGSSVEGEALLSTYSALVEPCTAAKRINEILDWIGVKKEERDITITIRDSGMEYSMMSMDDNTVGSLIDSILSVPDLLLRLTTLKPGDGAAGVKRIFFERAKEGRRFAPKTEAKLEKIEGLVESLTHLCAAITAARVWQTNVEILLKRSGVLPTGADVSAMRVNVHNVATKLGVAMNGFTPEAARGKPYEYKALAPRAWASSQEAAETADVAAAKADGWEFAFVEVDAVGTRTCYIRRQLPT